MAIRRGLKEFELSYWKAKAELEMMQAFKSDTRRLFEMEDSVAEYVPPSGRFNFIPAEYQKAVQRTALKHVEGYEEVRARVAKTLVKVVRLSSRLGCSFNVQSIPPRNVGGAIIPQNIFLAITADSTYGGVQRQLIFDAINQIIGLCEDKTKTEWNHIINPFYWIKVVFIFILRLPVNLTGLAGFNVNEFEKHFWGKLFNLVWIALLVGFLVWLGLGKADLVEVAKKLLARGSLE